MISVSYNIGNITHEVRTKSSPAKRDTIMRVTSPSVDLNEEKQLVEDAKSNAAGFGKLYDYYFPKMYAFVAAKVSSRDDAEDLTGDIFVKALENLANYEWRGLPFGAWLFRIARNTLNDYYQKAGRQKTSDIEHVYGVSEDEEQASPHKKAIKEELSEKVKVVLKDLPERDVNVIQLKFFSQMSNREIMDITGLSESNVAVIIFRTLKKIRPDLKCFS